jgi:tRNA threonylcarbamoyladenosine biosynthesis protein TsaB
LAPGAGYLAAMRLLAIDTALEACSVAVFDGDGRKPVVVSDVIGRGHAERLFGMIETAMRDAGLAFADLDRIAVTVGPGSFTGLRVGVAAARGFALAIGCPAIGIGTLDVHAETARENAGNVPVLAVLDARRDEIYGQRFSADGRPVGDAAVAPAGYFAAMVESGDVVAGNAADMVVALLPKGVAAPAIVHRRSAPDIVALARIGLRSPESNVAPRPLYLRPPDAKPQAAKAVARR